MANRFHLFFGGVARLQNCFSELKQPCSRWRRHHLRVPPLKQFNSRFKLRDARGNRRLRDGYSLRAFCESARFHNGNEVLNLIKFYM